MTRSARLPRLIHGRYEKNRRDKYDQNDADG